MSHFELDEFFHILTPKFVPFAIDRVVSTNHGVLLHRFESWDRKGVRNFSVNINRHYCWLI